MNAFWTWLAGVDSSSISLFFMSLVTIIILFRWHMHDGEFQLQQALVDNTSDKISIEKVGYMASLAVGTWGFVALMQHDKMTEGYFMGYLGVFALSRAASSGISVLKDIKTNVPTPPDLTPK